MEDIKRRQYEILEHVKSIRRGTAAGSSLEISPPREYVPHEPWPDTFEEYCYNNCNGHHAPGHDEVHGPGGDIEEDIHGDNIPPPPPSSWHEAACSWPRWD